ncbi:MAG TPA: glycogen debranching protein GlgX [Candidatus Hydrogenedens sp.]|nr:glycogen debranching protein GlgX [Candidatus Hydrogenedens sp.]
MRKVNPSEYIITPSKPYPFGSIVSNDGVRFTIFSRHAKRVWLAFFENIDDTAPAWEFEFDPKRHRIGDVWSIFIRGVSEGIYYMYRMDGPYDPRRGHRFNPSIYLLDPYGKAFVGDVDKGTMKTVVMPEEMGWEVEQPSHITMNELVIYETHVRGFTVHSSSGVQHPGTYQGLIEKIPYLKDLGINAVELLPVQEFGERRIGRSSLLTGEELINYWGYSNIGFFAPTHCYAVTAHRFEHLLEFRRMVEALHRSGMEIILDVVFNHTSEGNELGPTLCFRGIDNCIYYFLDKDGRYLNYSGCGNTLNCDHPIVRDFILDCLRYWVAIMHIDGFRFDLASILGRDEDGNVYPDAPLIERIAEDPVIRHVKLIAEAWDASGAYQVGSFGGLRWAEWNGRYRDDVRRYWRNDPVMHPVFATRIAGSSDLYQVGGRTPLHSINFVTCHDGFTLHDLVSYSQKHNEANGNNNRDGIDENFSCNYGIEGETDDPEINKIRIQMKKNFITTLFISLGVPMLLGGDEFGRTQKGNNNAYCQDNEISWYNWELFQKNYELYRFCKGIIQFRKENPAIRQSTFFDGIPKYGVQKWADITWFNAEGASVDWDGDDSVFGCRIDSEINDGYTLFIIFNNTLYQREFLITAEPWRLRVNTAEPSPRDYYERHQTRIVTERSVTIQPRSTIILEAKNT